MKYSFPKYDIIKDYFLLNYKIAYDIDLNTDLENFFTTQKDFEIDSFETQSPIFFEWKRYKFPVFIHNNNKNLFTDDDKISFDIYLNTFLFLSGWQEHFFTKKDKHGRFPFAESLQYKYDLVKIPIVNIYFELLFEKSKEKNIEITRKDFKEPIEFTHDIDLLRSGWFQNIQYELSHFSLKSFWEIPKNILAKVLGLKDDFYKGMEKMIEIDTKNNLNSISFLLMEKSHQNADFDITDKKYSKIIEKIIQVQKIGIHPTYESFDKKIVLNQEIKKLEKICNKKIRKSRQHFLRYDISKTPFIQEKTDIKEDYTLGFAEQYGFRNAIANPFYLFNFETLKAFDILQIPLVFMDVSLLNYSLEKDFEEVLVFMKNIHSNFNCRYSVLFHNSVFSEGKYKGFEKFYLQMIELNYL